MCRSSCFWKTLLSDWCISKCFSDYYGCLFGFRCLLSIIVTDSSLLPQVLAVHFDERRHTGWRAPNLHYMAGFWTSLGFYVYTGATEWLEWGTPNDVPLVHRDGLKLCPSPWGRGSKERRAGICPTEPAAAVEAPGKGRGSKAKIATRKTATGKEPASKELPTKNLSAKAPAHAVLVPDVHTKANDRLASLRSTTPSVADGGAAIDKVRPIRRMDLPGGEAFDQVEQSADLSLTNSVQITAPSILLSRDGPTYSIRSALKFASLMTTTSKSTWWIPTVWIYIFRLQVRILFGLSKWPMAGGYRIWTALRVSILPSSLWLPICQRASPS